MSLEELDHFILSCKTRNIRFDFIELTGGEPTLWPLFEEGVKKLVESEITERVTFITNGSSPELAVRVANQHNLRYVVSKTQATPAQIEYHKNYGVGVSWNTEPHIECPTSLHLENVPASCSQKQSREGFVVRELCYDQGKVWYCCTAEANMRRLGVDDPTLCCNFDDDYDTFFKDRKFDRTICGSCLCNSRMRG
jgi:hypothetical protein